MVLKVLKGPLSPHIILNTSCGLWYFTLKQTTSWPMDFLNALSDLDAVGERSLLQEELSLCTTHFINYESIEQRDDVKGR